MVFYWLVMFLLGLFAANRTNEWGLRLIPWVLWGVCLLIWLNIFGHFFEEDTHLNDAMFEDMTNATVGAVVWFEIAVSIRKVWTKLFGIKDY